MTDSDRRRMGKLRFRTDGLRWGLLLFLCLLWFSGDRVRSIHAGEKIAADIPATGSVQVVIELEDSSVAETYLEEKQRLSQLETSQTEAMAVAAAIRTLQRVEKSQQELLSFLTSPNIEARPMYRVQRVYNGIGVTVAASRLMAIAVQPGVRRIRRLIPKYPDKLQSIPFIGAPTLWSLPGIQVTGNGIRIGVIDTGIDYLHKDFGGGGDPSNYAGNNPTKIGDTAPFFPGTKVVGGWDFVGDDYNGSNMPLPDPDPMDNRQDSYGSYLGHGTHVAGILSGYGVKSDGSTYRGPYAGIDYASADLKIGPGVAPEAQLYALKIFGRTGSTTMTDQAIEWATDPNGDGNFSDRLDIINLSLGSDYGSIEDTSSLAIQRAAQLGVITVVAAGNAGDSHYNVSGPGVVQKAISVAGSYNDIGESTYLKVLSPGDVPKLLYSANDADFGPAFPSEGLIGYLALAAPADGCSALTNGESVFGKIAVIDRGQCTFVQKVKNAQNAGASAVLVVNNTPGYLDTDLGGSDASIVIPSAFITLEDGTILKERLGTPGVFVSIWHISYAETVYGATSRGPRPDDSLLKPDIAAPAIQVDSALSYTGTASVTMSGTSMATPHISGAMALIKQLHPAWSVHEWKALLMNSAADIFLNPDRGLPQIAPSRVGAGRVDLTKAASLQFLAYDAQNPDGVSLSFGYAEVSDSWIQEKTVFLANKGNQPADVEMSYRSILNIPGVEISFPQGNRVTVPANGARTIPVRLTAVPYQMKHLRDESMAAQQKGASRHWVSEESGYVLFTENAGGMTFRLPLHASPRLVSDIGAPATPLTCSGATGQLSLNLNGSGVWTGSSFPQDEISLVSPFEYLRSSPENRELTGLDKKFDLRAVGIRTGYNPADSGSQSFADSSLYLAIATFGEWASPNEVDFRILFDTNRDGIADYTLRNASSSYGIEGASATDAFLSLLCSHGTGKCASAGFVNILSPALLDTVPFHTNILILPVKVSDLGLTEQKSGFSVTFESYRPNPQILEDRISGITYDAARPGLAFRDFSSDGSFFRYPLQERIPIDYFRNGYLANQSAGLLLLYHHNPGGKHIQTINVAFTNDPASTTTSSTIVTTTSTSTTATSSSLVPTSISVSTTTSSTPYATTTTLNPPTRLYFPQIVSNDQSDTGISIINRSSSSAQLTFKLYRGYGWLMAGTVRSVSPGAQVVEPVSSLFPNTSLSSAWMVVESSQSEVNGFFLQYDRQLTMMDGANVSGNLLPEFLLPFADGETVSILNPGEALVNLRVDSFKEDGTSSHATQIVLPQRSKVDMAVSSLRPEGQQGGYLRGSGEGGLVVVGLCQGNGRLSAVSGLNPAKGAIKQYAPQYAVGGGFSTVLEVINLETLATTLTIRLLGEDGQPVAQARSLTISIPGQGSARITPNQLNLKVESPLVQGYAVLESTGGKFTGVVTFTDAENAVMGSSLPLVASGVSSSWFLQVAQNDQYYTGLAIMNPTSQNVEVIIDVFSEKGMNVGKGFLSLPAGRRVSQVLANLVPNLSAMSKGYFRVMASQPLPAFALFGTRNGKALSAIPAQ